MIEVDSRAVVSPSAKIGTNVKIGAYAVVGDEVELGDDCILDHHAVVQGPSRLGKANHVYPFASVGGDPQDLTFKGERVTLEVGDYNEFREFSTVNRGTVKGGGDDARRQPQFDHVLRAYRARLPDRRLHDLRQWRNAGGTCGRGGLRADRRVLPGASVLPDRKIFVYRARTR